MVIIANWILNAKHFFTYKLINLTIWAKTKSKTNYRVKLKICNPKWMIIIVILIVKKWMPLVTILYLEDRLLSCQVTTHKWKSLFWKLKTKTRTWKLRTNFIKIQSLIKRQIYWIPKSLGTLKIEIQIEFPKEMIF